MTDISNPVLIAASQRVQRKGGKTPLDPLRLMIEACRDTLRQVDGERIRETIDAIYMININSWSYADAPQELADALGITPKTKVYLPDGGDTPQMLVNRAAKAIASKKSKAVLIAGAEAKYSASKGKRGDLNLDWPKNTPPNYMEGPLWKGLNAFENRYKLISPPVSYALFENANRAHLKRDLKKNEQVMGKIFERFSAVAAENPYAWDQTAYSAEEITKPTHENRLITYPYTKRMCSNMFVDQSAAVLMTSEHVASELGIDKDQWVYLMGGANLKDIHEITQRPEIYSSVPMREGAKVALKQAGLTIDEINAFEFYSCFPSIVQIMMREIGLPLEDPRPITLTGGMPFFGGPWSLYSLHGVVSAYDYVKERQDSHVLLVANGGYNTKKSIGIYGKQPPSIPWTERDDSELQERIYSRKLEKPVKKVEGKNVITVEAYTIPHDRSGKPQYGIILGHLKDGRKTLAMMMGDADSLLKYEQKELIGTQFEVIQDDKLNQNIIKL